MEMPYAIREFSGCGKKFGWVCGARADSWKRGHVVSRDSTVRAGIKLLHRRALLQRVRFAAITKTYGTGVGTDMVGAFN